jgi:TRAP-type transport system periplasmic protein
MTATTTTTTMARAWIFAAMISIAAGARAETYTLRMSTPAPDGSAWGREIRAWARDVESVTNGEVRVKLYMGGLAGDELQVLDHIRRDQLDGALGSEICTMMAPSMRVSRVAGLFQDRDESSVILTRLKPILDAEFLKSGFVHLGTAGLGPEVLFLRNSVANFEDLKKQRLIVWDLDKVMASQVRAMGLTTVLLPLADQSRVFEEQKADGWIAVPTAALAFQWTAQAKYFLNLHLSFRSGCLLVATRAFDALPGEIQQQLKSTAGKLRARFEQVGLEQDQALLGGLLQKQGMKPLPVTDQMRAEFFEAARTARNKPGVVDVPQELVARVQAWLADFRAEHPTAH